MTGKKSRFPIFVDVKIYEQSCWMALITMNKIWFKMKNFIILVGYQNAARKWAGTLYNYCPLRCASIWRMHVYLLDVQNSVRWRFQFWVFSHHQPTTSFSIFFFALSVFVYVCNHYSFGNSICIKHSPSKSEPFALGGKKRRATLSVEIEERKKKDVYNDDAD